MVMLKGTCCSTQGRSHALSQMDDRTGRAENSTRIGIFLCAHTKQLPYRNSTLEMFDMHEHRVPFYTRTWAERQQSKLCVPRSSNWCVLLLMHPSYPSPSTSSVQLRDMVIGTVVPDTATKRVSVSSRRWWSGLR